MPTQFGLLFNASLLFSIVSFAAAAGLAASCDIAKRAPPRNMLALLYVNCVAGFATWIGMHPHWQLLAPSSTGLLLPHLLSRKLKDYTFTGCLLLSAHLLATTCGLLWGLWVISTAPVGLLTRTLMFLGYPVVLLSLFVGLIQSFEQWEVICRRRWSRARLPAPSPRRQYPKVSLHVPTYSEPPSLVIATLDSLARLDYPNFEVLVIDNNTSDSSLWRPVEAHCRRLGERFRFFHVDKLAGAKAGALNFALRHTAADAEVIGVVDSDYLVEPNFVSALIDCFDDPEMGFVQTPQAYREWEPHSYLRICNWEYKLVFATTLVSRNERMAAITVGTMGLIRRKALEEVGGWAEWCVTEDSELAVRIHARGYRSMYVNAVFGRGLVPETFADYKKQRFRWTFGPVQELRRHIRLFLPRPLARPSALTAAQKIHHTIHGLGALKSGLEFLLLPLGAAIVASMLLHGESIQLPPTMWLIVFLGGVTALGLKWHLFRLMGCSVTDTVGASLASMALDHTIRMAGLRALLTRGTAWRRTNKFRSLPLGLGALSSAAPEMLLAAGIWTATAGILIDASTMGLLRLFLLGAVVQSARYVAAPVMALLAERGVSRRNALLGTLPKDDRFAQQPST